MPKKKTSTLEKNRHILLELLVVKRETFFRDLINLQKEYGLVRNKEKILKQLKNYPEQGFNVKKKEMEKAEKAFINFWKSFKNPLDFNKFCSKIRDILKNYDLSEEWFSTIGLLVAAGVIIPPTYNLTIKTDSFHKKIAIQLNKTTSLEDVEEAWGEININKKKILGEGRSNKYSRKFPENLYSYMRSVQLHLEGPDETVYEEENYQIKDEDIVSDLSPDLAENGYENDIKRGIDRLRQTRRRIKDKEK